MTRTLRAAILSACLGFSGAAAAQQANPLDVVPDKMPFNIPYGAPISLALGSIAISEHKARASVKFRRPTKAFEEGIQKNDYKYQLTLDDVIGSRGGIPLVEDGKLIGAIGCSGGAGSQDEVACTTAAATINK